MYTREEIYFIGQHNTRVYYKLEFGELLSHTIILISLVPKLSTCGRVREDSEDWLSPIRMIRVIRLVSYQESEKGFNWVYGAQHLVTTKNVRMPISGIKKKVYHEKLKAHEIKLHQGRRNTPWEPMSRHELTCCRVLTRREPPDPEFCIQLHEQPGSTNPTSDAKRISYLVILRNIPDIVMRLFWKSSKCISVIF